MKISQKQQAAASAPGCNLLKNRFIGGFIKSKWYPGIFKWPTVFSFVLIMYILLFGPTIAHNNLGTALTWVLWWPLIPIILCLWGVSGAPSAPSARSTTWCRSLWAIKDPFPYS